MADGGGAWHLARPDVSGDPTRRGSEGRRAETQAAASTALPEGAQAGASDNSTVASCEFAASVGAVFFLARAFRRPLAVVLLWLAAIFVLGSAFAGLRGRETRWDFSHYYASALALRQGLDPYTTSLKPIAKQFGLHLGAIDRATYPPTFLLLFEPLTFFSPHAAYWTWFAANLCFLAIALFSLLGPASGLDLADSLALAAWALLYPPLATHFFYAQSQLLILVLLVAMERSLAAGRPVLGGLALAAAVLLRAFPLVMVGYLVVRRHWSALRWTVFWGAVAGVLTLALVGVGRSFDFLRVVSFLTGPYWLARPANVALGASVSGVFWFFFGFHAGPAVDFVRQAVSLGAELGLLALTVRVTLAASGDDDSELRCFSLWVVTTVLLSPTAWFHYLVLLYILFAALTAAGRRGTAGARVLNLGLLSYGLAFAYVIVLAVPSGRFHFPTLAVVSMIMFASLACGYGAAYCFAAETCDRRLDRKVSPLTAAGGVRPA